MKDEREGSDGGARPADVFDWTWRLNVARSVEVEDDDDREEVEDEDEGCLRREAQGVQSLEEAERDVDLQEYQRPGFRDGFVGSCIEERKALKPRTTMLTSSQRGPDWSSLGTGSVDGVRIL